MMLSRQGAQEVFRELPHTYVEPHELKTVAEHGREYSNGRFLTLLADIKLGKIVQRLPECTGA